MKKFQLLDAMFLPIPCLLFNWICLPAYSISHLVCTGSQ